MTYKEALAYIQSLEPRGWRLGLDRMRAFAEQAGLVGSLGDGEAPRFAHVAGTNGKGSVTAMLQSIFVEAGFRTGSFFSPYVVDPRERVQFGRELIREDELVGLTEELRRVAEAMEGTEFAGVTEFEFKTALGFAYWKQKQAEWVALEVGLGGRLDATNIVTPAVTIIVSIGLDHVSILGNTMAAIAREKAGIIKPGIPVIVGSMVDEAREVIEEVAAEKGAPIWRFGHEILLDRDFVQTPAGGLSGIYPGMVGSMQPHNAALAVAAIHASGAKVSDDAIRDGIELAYAPGRFERKVVRDQSIIFDGAHNPAAAMALLRTLASQGIREVSLVTNMLAGHDPDAFYQVLRPILRRTHVIPVDFFRAMPVPVAVARLRGVLPNVYGYASVREGLEAALKDGLPVLVTGSNYAVGAVMTAADAMAE